MDASFQNGYSCAEETGRQDHSIAVNFDPTDTCLCSTVRHKDRLLERSQDELHLRVSEQKEAFPTVSVDYNRSRQRSDGFTNTKMAMYSKTVSGSKTF